jgi:hypothetical protein
MIFLQGFIKFDQDISEKWSGKNVFVEGVQSNISISTIYHMGIAKTPDKKHNVYITKQYGKTEDNIQSSKKGIGKDTWCFERASYLQIRI